LSPITRLCLLGAAALLPLPVAQAQEQQPQIRASVDVVRLSVSVVHTADGVIPPLTVDDFAVYDNGVEQEARLLLRPQDTPLRVALLVDASPSIRPWWPTVQRAAVSFLARLPADACPYVLPFSEGIGPGRWGRYPANDWRRFLADAPRGAGTALYDALVIALQELAFADELAGIEPPAPADPAESPGAVARSPQHTAPTTRATMLERLEAIVAQIIADNPLARLGGCDLKPPSGETAGGATVAPDESINAVLLLSDGDDFGSLATAEDVIDAARLAGVPVFPVLLGNASRLPELAALLEETARATGGLVHDVSVDGLGEAYARVLGYLRSTYVLAYDPGPAEPGAESWHEVRVELRRPLLRAVARPGYYR